MSVFIPIPKKGNAKECLNYCTIALISHVSKVMLKSLQARLQQYVNDVNELLEQGKVREENYNKLLENSEYKKYKEKYEKERLDVLEEIQKEIRNPFYWIKEFILYTAIYPIMRFINRSKKNKNIKEQQ